MRVWAKFTKGPEVRFISHRDILKVMTRAMRRAEVPIAFSQGYNPHPKISFAAPLPLGATSEGEYMDIILNEERDLLSLQEQLNETMPPGVHIYGMRHVEDTQPTLMAWIDQSIYRISGEINPDKPQEEVEQLINEFRNRSEIMFDKETKRRTISVDVSTWIHSLDVCPPTVKGICLKVNLQTGQHGNFKAEEFIGVLQRETGISFAEHPQIHRLELLGPHGRNHVPPFLLLSQS